MTTHNHFPSPDHDHGACNVSMLAHAEHICAKRGARLTRLRRDVLVCLAKDHQAVGAYELMARMGEGAKAQPAAISIYRALAFLQAHGLVHKIESLNAYVACSHVHKDAPAVLLICEACGMVAEMPFEQGFMALKQQAQGLGFHALRAVVELAGRCGRCVGMA